MKRIIALLILFSFSILLSQDGRDEYREGEKIFMKENRVYQGDSLGLLKKRPDNSIDAVVTDPPYGIKFMGKKWDYNVPATAIWREVLRVLKPGGHLLSFSGSRTYHKMASNIESAGFEIRDQLLWIYGSGFPKSMKLGNALKKKEGAVAAGIFAGWGTALKPAHEPIVMARKPLDGKTIVANVLKWGTGGLNIDASRVPGEVKSRMSVRTKYTSEFLGTLKDSFYDGSKGRHPSNLILDESAARYLDDLFGKSISKYFYVVKPTRKEKGEFNNHPTVKPVKLIEYLVRMVTPADGIVLDLFSGSGTTALACDNTGFKWLLFEKEKQSVMIARKRIRLNRQNRA